MNEHNARSAASFIVRGSQTGVLTPSQPLRGRPMTPLTAAIFAVLYPASMTLAQQAGSESLKLEEIVVTATRRDVNLQNVGQSVTAFSTADIEQQAFRGTPDLIAALPSVNLISSTPGRSTIVMRGVSTGSAEYRTDSQVAVYLDDQPMTSISTQVDVQAIDLARVEALPGPQGTLFGSSSQSGTLVYVTNKPDPTGFSSQVDAEIGTTKGGDESYAMSGHVNIPVTDNIAIRAVGFYTFDGGYVDNILGPTLADATQDNASVVEKNQNDYTTYGGRIAARWQINPDWESTLSLISQFSEAEGAWESDPALGDYKITRFFDEYRDDDWYQTSLNVKGDLGFAELSLTASYFDRSIKYEWDNANYSQWRSAYYGGFDPEYGAGSYNIYNTGVLIGTEFNDQKQERSAFEARLTSQGESRFAWMAGAFFEDVTDEWDNPARLPGLTNTTAWDVANYYACIAQGLGYDIACPLPPTDIYYSNKYRKNIKQTALFGEVTYDLTDRWSITGGARWFEYDRDQREVYNQPLGLPIGSDFEGGAVNASEGKESDTVFKFATQFEIDDDRMIYFLYSEGFRLGGSNSERAAENGFLPLNYESDKLSNYEVGLKSQWLDDRVQFNLSVFFMEWDQIQLNVSGSRADNPFWLRGTFNGGKAEQKGVEMNGVWQVTEDFNIQASAFFADPEFSEDTIYPDPDDGIAIPAGTTMPVSPEEKYWIALDYTLPNFFDLPGKSWTRFSYSYQGEVWRSTGAILDFIEATTPEERAEARELLLPSYSTSTFQLGFTADTGWETALIVRNLFDETGYNYISGSNYGEFFGDERYKYIRSLQRPRSISLSFSKKWK